MGRAEHIGRFEVNLTSPSFTCGMRLVRGFEDGRKAVQKDRATEDWRMVNDA